jgi:hypothetical protein
MTALAPHEVPAVASGGDRRRLIALALAGWHDHVRVPASRPLGESGCGEATTVSGRTSTRRRDELLLCLDARETSKPMSLAAYRRASRPGDLERGGHPCWSELERAMSVLAVRDPFGHQVLVETLVAEPLPGMDWRRVVAAIHALPFLAGGVSHAVSAPRYGLVRALGALDELLPANLSFPREVHDQVEGWSEWLASVRAAGSAKQQRSRSYQAATRLRDAHIVELSEMAGWPQSRIAHELGVSQATVSRAIGRAAA